MTPGAPLTPAGALGWLRSMSVDIREAAVLDAAGSVLAGDVALAPAASASVQAQAGASAPSAAGEILVVRSTTHAIVVRRGPCAIERLLYADLRAALDALGFR